MIAYLGVQTHTTLLHYRISERNKTTKCIFKHHNGIYPPPPFLSKESIVRCEQIRLLKRITAKHFNGLRMYARKLPYVISQCLASFDGKGIKDGCTQATGFAVSTKAKHIALFGAFNKGIVQIFRARPK